MLIIKNRSVNRSRRCAAPSLCTQNSIMNAITAHKDELKKLLENVSGDTAVLGITNCSNIWLRHQSAARANKQRINMEPTLTQNCALYLAQHKTSKRRAALFKTFRTLAGRQGPDVRRRLASGDLFIVPPPHQDNGR